MRRLQHDRAHPQTLAFATLHAKRIAAAGFFGSVTWNEFHAWESLLPGRVRRNGTRFANHQSLGQQETRPTDFCGSSVGETFGLVEKIASPRGVKNVIRRERRVVGLPSVAGYANTILDRFVEKII